MSQMGSKAENLIRIRDEFEIPVPDFKVIAFDTAFANFEEISARLEKLVNDFLRSGFDAVSVAPELITLTKELKWNEPELEKIHQDLLGKKWAKVSFRTSAALEDNAGNSFAGQYESFVDVEYTKPALRHHIMECLRSILSARVIGYAKNQGLKQFLVAGSCIVQEMFYGTTSGVLFTEDGSGNLSIYFTESWRNVVVEGADSQHLEVPRAELDQSKVAQQFKTLARLALSIEDRIGAPVDVEFSFDKSEVVLLQFRPVTVPMLEYVLDWDSTNISENYPGVTLPLTYSTIRSLYAGVYPAFLRMLGTKESVLVANSAIFDNMLGYLNGHVYYRMSSWYQGLSLIPGKRNQQYFEAMLNPVNRKENSAPYSKGLDWRSIVTILKFVSLLLRSERLSRQFRDRIDERIKFYDTYKTDYLSAQSIILASKKIRVELLAEWAVPILNDIKLMVFHGILKRVFFKGDNHQAYLEFLQGLTDRASLKPLQALAELGSTIRSAMETENVTTVDALKRSKSWAIAKAAIDEYNKNFGARTPDELKLENQRLSDNTAALAQLALNATSEPIGVENSKTQWPAHVNILKRPLLAYVAKNTRRAIDWRERFRFNRAQTFNLSRNTINSLAKIFKQEGIIRDLSDIYWLTESELDEIVNAHAWSLDVQQTIKQRKAKLKEYETAKMQLAVQGAGKVAGNHLTNVTPRKEGDLSGSGVAPGLLTAEVVVATEFDPKLDVRGKILVVHHVDPGWTLLFTQAAGIVAERGNALSHAAIIAREIGIPAIVAAVGATTTLRTGQSITINGVTGAIRNEKN